jgi:hypothetical protein
VRLHGIDFTSRPRPAKPITIASGALSRSTLTVDSRYRLEDFAAFEHWLRHEGPWLAAFDFPFALPRDFVVAQAWPTKGIDVWQRITGMVAALPLAELRERARAYCDARPAGEKFAHRASDRLAKSSPSMKWVNPPVLQMLHAGAPRLLASGVDIPGLHAGDPKRIALEGYPGMLARRITKAAYKSDEKAKQTPARAEARREIIGALLTGDHPLAITVEPSAAILAEMEGDASGDALDAVLCAVQAAWAWKRRAGNFGLPAKIDPVEGWIVSCDAGQ